MPTGPLESTSSSSSASAAGESSTEPIAGTSSAPAAGETTLRRSGSVSWAELLQLHAALEKANPRDRGMFVFLLNRALDLELIDVRDLIERCGVNRLTVEAWRTSDYVPLPYRRRVIYRLVTRRVELLARVDQSSFKEKPVIPWRCRLGWHAWGPWIRGSAGQCCKCDHCPAWKERSHD